VPFIKNIPGKKKKNFFDLIMKHKVACQPPRLQIPQIQQHTTKYQADEKQGRECQFSEILCGSIAVHSAPTST